MQLYQFSNKGVLLPGPFVPPAATSPATALGVRGARAGSGSCSPLVGFVDEDHAFVFDVLLYDGCHGFFPLGYPREETVHPRQVILLVIPKQSSAPRVLLLHELRLVRGEELRLNGIEEPGLAGVVEVAAVQALRVVDSALLEVEAALCLDEVVGASVTLDPVNGFVAEVRAGFLQEILLKVCLVRAHRAQSDLHENLQYRLEQVPVNVLPFPFLLDEGQDSTLDVVLYLGVDDVAEAHHPHVMKQVQVEARNVVAV
mmetsp:Transcript_8359/g.21553  ORF Transcript_8359/g.21553 Transcript_8359/m.21553 type:complete len:257 (-) Transcript_8359:720-1490(-)